MQAWDVSTRSPFRAAFFLSEKLFHLALAMLSSAIPRFDAKL